MSDSIRTESFEICHLSEDQRRYVFDTIGLLAQRYFEGAGVQPLREALSKSAVPVVEAQLFWQGDEPVGFAVLTLDSVCLRGTPSQVVRGFCALRADLRGRNRVLPFYIRSTLRLLWRHRHTPIWAFVPAVHPGSYRLLAAHVPVMIPHPAREPREEELRAIEELATHFHCERRAGDHPLVCRRSMAVKEAGSIPPLPRKQDELDRYFLEVNPDFAQGACLMVLLRVNLANILGSAWSLACTRLLRPLRMRGGRLQTSGLPISV